MKGKCFSLFMAAVLMTAAFPAAALAEYEPPAGYSAPANVGVVFNGDELDENEDGRWSFTVGLSASDEVREIVKAYEDGLLDEAGFDSFHVGVQGDYRIDDGKWRSELEGYDDWVYNQESGFSSIDGAWVTECYYDDYMFDEVIPDGILPGGKSYFDDHTVYFRLRFYVSFYRDQDYLYYSPWSSEVSYSNNQKTENPDALIDHAPEILSVELKKNDDGRPYLDFTAAKAHEDLQLLNNISNQRVYTNVWIRVNGGKWVDAGSYFWMREKFDIEAGDYFADADSFDAAVYEVKFRYTFDYSYYPVSGKSGEIYSPFSNVISHGMPAYEGAHNWARQELDKAAGYGLITDSIKGNVAENITREEFAEIALKLYEVYTGEKAEAGSISFVDSSNPVVLKAANLGLITGVGGNKFEPKTLVTREQMATILLRALKVINPSADFSADGAPKFADDSKVKKYARDGVYFCSKAGILTGVGANMFDPEGPATREMAIVVCTRAYEYFR